MLLAKPQEKTVNIQPFPIKKLSIASTLSNPPACVLSSSRKQSSPSKSQTREPDRNSPKRRLQKRGFGFDPEWNSLLIPYFIYEGETYPSPQCYSDSYEYEKWKENTFSTIRNSFNPVRLQEYERRTVQEWIKQGADYILYQTSARGFPIQFYEAMDPFRLIQAGRQVLIVVVTKGEALNSQAGTLFTREYRQEHGMKRLPWGIPPMFMALNIDKIKKRSQDGLESPKRALLHELFHVLGGHHEHQRSDRDKYLIFNPYVTKERLDSRADFREIKQGESFSGFSVCMSGEYDFKSISHYPLADLHAQMNRYPRGCSEGDLRNLAVLNVDEVGRKEEFSKGDLEFLEKIYKGKPRT